MTNTIRTSVYLLAEPEFTASGDLRHVSIIGVRQNPPTNLRREGRAVRLVLEIPRDFFTPPLVEAVIPSTDTDPAAVSATVLPS